MKMMMPKGEYYIGDLCYVMHDVWDEVHALMFQGENEKEGVFILKDGRKFAIFSTAHGDGSYYDWDGKEYGVDAGVIGCIATKDIVKREDNINGMTGGNVHVFENDFEVKSDEGNICFGNIAIDTDCDEDDDFDEDYHDYDYEEEDLDDEEEEDEEEMA